MISNFGEMPVQEIAAVCALATFIPGRSLMFARARVLEFHGQTGLSPEEIARGLMSGRLAVWTHTGKIEGFDSQRPLKYN